MPTTPVITAAKRFLIVGDSISSGGGGSYDWPYGDPGGLVDQIQANWPLAPAAPNPSHATGAVGVVVSGNVGQVANSQPVAKTLNAFNSAVSGLTANTIAANMN